jgi:anti-sigma factor RsiW
MSSPCQWIRGVLTAYLDGELKPSTAKAVRRHLEHCESCRAHARLLRDSWGLLDESPPAPVRAGFTERMMARIVEEKDLNAVASRLRPHRVRQRVVASVLGMAAGLVLGFVAYSWTGLPQEPTSPVERDVSHSVSFIEDVDLLDEIAVIQAIDRLVIPDETGDGV